MPAAISMLAALDEGLAIGRGNQLPWHLPDDLRRFKALTLGKPLLMGRKTAQSLGRALPGRRNLVLTRSTQVPFPGMEPVHSMEEAVDEAAGEELMVIGGGEIYALALPLATTLYLTHVHTRTDDADAWFPAWDAAHWRVLSRQRHAADERHAFDFEFVDYIRA